MKASVKFFFWTQPGLAGTSWVMQNIPVTYICTTMTPMTRVGGNAPLPFLSWHSTKLQLCWCSCSTQWKCSLFLLGSLSSWFTHCVWLVFQSLFHLQCQMRQCLSPMQHRVCGLLALPLLFHCQLLISSEAITETQKHIVFLCCNWKVSVKCINYHSFWSK